MTKRPYIIKAKDIIIELFDYSHATCFYFYYKGRLIDVMNIPYKNFKQKNLLKIKIKGFTLEYVFHSDHLTMSVKQDGIMYVDLSDTPEENKGRPDTEIQHFFYKDT